MKLSNQQEMSRRCKLRLCVWERGKPKLFDIHAMGDLMLQHPGWLQIPYVFPCFDHCLFLTRTIAHFYSVPPNPISPLQFCYNTAGSFFSFHLFFSSFHASCLMVSLYLREDTFFDKLHHICHKLVAFFQACLLSLDNLGMLNGATIVLSPAKIAMWQCLLLSLCLVFVCLQRHVSATVNCSLTLGLVFAAMYFILLRMYCHRVDVSSVTQNVNWQGVIRFFFWTLILVFRFLSFVHIQL